MRPVRTGSTCKHTPMTYGTVHRRTAERHTEKTAICTHGGKGARGTAPGPRAASRRGASRPDASRKGAVCGPHVAQNALFRYITAREAWGATARQPAGHYGKWPNWANVLEQPPARLRGGCARVRKPRPGARLHGKAQSGQRASLMAHPGPGRDTIGLPVVGYGGAGNSGLTNH